VQVVRQGGAVVSALPQFMDEAPYQRLSYDDLAMVLHASKTQPLHVLARILGVQRRDVVANLRSIGAYFRPMPTAHDPITALSKAMRRVLEVPNV